MEEKKYVSMARKVHPSKQMSEASSSNQARPSPSNENFEAECLEAHNRYREIHGTPPMTLSRELCKFASDWAGKLAREDKFQHRPNNKYGENIFMKWSSNTNETISGQEVVESWYNEINDHEFDKEPQRLIKSVHFTQVIWKATNELGVAKKQSGKGNFIVVANYNPCGNTIGEFIENVPSKKA
uniref:Cysteine-rich venom protein n=1 Tax=Strigamia maritima TaxID=126957 RepID=T1J5T5_STRMM